MEEEEVTQPPADTEVKYEEVDKVDFPTALIAIKEGKAGTVAYRAGWAGAGVFIFLVQGSKFKVNRAPLLGIYEEGTEVTYHGHIDMKTMDGTIMPWTPLQADMLANDWIIATKI